MNIITQKRTTLRVAKAQAIVFCSPKTIERVLEKTVPKGDVIEFTRAVGFMAAKKTPELLPFCHPIPIEGVTVEVFPETDQIRIEVSIEAIARTGVEVEAMATASTCALNLYDMLKPIDSELVIGEIKLLSKTGGKSGSPNLREGVTAAILVCSDRNQVEENYDKSGQLIAATLKDKGFDITEQATCPDDPEEIASQVEAWLQKDIDLIITTGGTGLSKRDNTVEAILPLLTERLHGFEQAIQQYGMERTPYAVLSRSLAGRNGQSLIICLPGSVKAVHECLEAIFPWLIHAVNLHHNQHEPHPHAD